MGIKDFYNKYAASGRGSQSREGIARKARSEAALRAEGVPINGHLPVIEDAAQVPVRSAAEVTQRAFCLMAVAVKAEVFNDGDVVEFHPTLQGIIDIHGIDGDLTPDEAAFAADMAPDEHTAMQFVWRYEALWTLMWALGLADELEYPTGICDVTGIVTRIHDLGPEGFRTAANLRPANELLDAADFIYRLHWAVRNAELDQSPQVDGVEAGVVMERHHALNWLIGSEDTAWDDISTST